MKQNDLKLIGPFSQLVTMDKLALKGPLTDDRLEVVDQAGILIRGNTIEATGNFRELQNRASVTEETEGSYVALPGLIDVHTHLCWAGSRAMDYSLRLSGKNYLEIAAQEGGIWSTVAKTREANFEELFFLTVNRTDKLLHQGVTTVEVKSGYGLNPESELKMLKVIQKVHENTELDLIATCLAAHIKPHDFNGSAREYLELIVRELLPVVKEKNLSRRVDIYIDKGAFGNNDARYYLEEAKKMGFDLTAHADQFSEAGLQVAVESGAMSADHLEVISDFGIKLIAQSNVAAVVLPGASIGLGTGFAPARKIIDAGASLVIASDWNPGSAPMGNLLMQSSVLGIFEKLTTAEILAAITYRAAKALGLNDRGVLKPGMMADFIAFPCSDYREVLYNQGSLEPEMVWKKGKRV